MSLKARMGVAAGVAAMTPRWAAALESAAVRFRKSLCHRRSNPLLPALATVACI